MRRVSFICLLIPAFSANFFSLPNLNSTEYRGNYKALTYSENQSNEEQGPPECSPGDMASTGGRQRAPRTVPRIQFLKNSPPGCRKLQRTSPLK
jgi:hypothetical protein